ncbi:MAG: hypothetical protein JKY32_02935 [Rhizobiales bacterium]|nr:hypothetical protein [Hyphomicrobiales bacterium]
MANFIFLFLLFPLLATSLWAAPGFAADTFSLPYEDRQVYYKSDRGMDIRELLGEEAFQIYSAALETKNCDPAYALLANAYANAYPDEPHPGSDFSSRLDWEVSIISRHYRGLALCLELRDLGELQAKLAREGVQMEPLSQSDLGAPHDNDTVTSIIVSVLLLSGMAGNGYTPAAMAMLRLSEEGEVFRFTQAFRYYVALRLRIRGLDTEEVADITARAAARLDAETIAELTRQAADGHFIYSGEWLE